MWSTLVQVQGRILELGKDPRGDTDPRYAGKVIDYTTEVKTGTLLAQIDDSVYKANRDQAQASLDRAKADQNQLDAKLRKRWRSGSEHKSYMKSSSPVCRELPVLARMPRPQSKAFPTATTI